MSQICRKRNRTTRKPTNIPTLVLTTASWNALENCIYALLGKVKVANLDLKSWLKPIMDSYLNTWKLTIDSKTLIIDVTGIGHVMKEFIPQVRSSMYHLLTVNDEKKLHLAHIEKRHPTKMLSFFAQFSFRLFYDSQYPFMVVLEGSAIDRFVWKIEINGVEVHTTNL